jgi:hypothetical protein
MSLEIVDVASTVAGVRNAGIGWGMSALVIAFLLLDSVMKLMALPVVLEAGESIGFPGAPMSRALGTLLPLLRAT